MAPLWKKTLALKSSLNFLKYEIPLHVESSFPLLCCTSTEAWEAKPNMQSHRKFKFHILWQVRILLCSYLLCLPSPSPTLGAHKTQSQQQHFQGLCGVILTPGLLLFAFLLFHPLPWLAGVQTGLKFTCPSMSIKTFPPFLLYSVSKSSPVFIVRLPHLLSVAEWPWNISLGDLFCLVPSH